MSRPVRPASGAGAQPVQVRLTGEETAVRTMVAALQRAAACGPASYRPARHGDGIRAYLSLVIPTDAESSGGDAS